MKILNLTLKVVDASPEVTKADLEKILTDAEAAELVKAWLGKAEKKENDSKAEV